MLVDTHAHIDDVKYDEDRDEMVDMMKTAMKWSFVLKNTVLLAL